MTSSPTYIGSCHCEEVCARWKQLTISQYEVLAAGLATIKVMPALDGDFDLWGCALELAERATADVSLGALSSALVLLPHLPVWLAANRERLWADPAEGYWLSLLVLVEGPVLELLLAPWRSVVKDSGRDRLVVWAAVGWDGSVEDLLEGVRLAYLPPLA